MTPRRMMALPRDDESNEDAHQGSRRRPPRATKAARCTGVDEALFASTMNDAKDDDVAPRDEDSNNGAIDDADDGAEKGAKPRATGKADKYGARHVRTATTPHNSDDNSDDSADKVEKPRATAGLREACTRGSRPQQRHGDVTATVLRRRDGKVTATAAMVGATALRQRWRNCDTTASKDNACTNKAVSAGETHLRWQGGANRQAGHEHDGS